MNKEQKNLENQHQQSEKVARKQQHHGMEKGIGAVGGGVTGAVVGSKLIGGKTGAVVGAIAGAVVGGTVGEAAIEDLEELERKAMKTLGEAPGENKILAHYSWEELQALSKPQT
ncbi:glycine zipper 2TM domain-containing protein [Myxosarcina sp. GI1]|uniref:glycine zipper 2TM domain-containing protein n=1 Tax=Myxosarcina sp. GI1 TaxID=1541065 RepID=UPI00068A4239|nr:glycine zipper domain-containing protein [Myxosarcina sp. GI1]